MIDPAPSTATPATGRDRPLFLLSFRQRDELAALAAKVGWRVVAARRSDGAERRFLASGATVAVVDARGAVDEGLTAVRALAGPTGANGGALLVLVSRNDAARLDEFYDAGATQFLASPMREAEFVQALRFAARHARRVGGEGTTPTGAAEPLGWRYDPALESVQVTPALAAMLGLSEQPSVRTLLRRVEATDRGALRSALARLRQGLQATAFAHELTGAGRVVEHLQRDDRTGRIHGLIERLGQVDASAAVRDALKVRDAAGARRWIERRLQEGRPLTVVLAALSRFDVINTAYGRAAGDSVLRAASARLAEAAREAGGRRAIVARMGGAEFLVAAGGPDAAALASAAARIEEVLARPFVIGDEIAPMGARAAAAASEPGDTVAALLKRASETLAGEGAAGAELPVDALAVDLRRAMEAGEIELRFQPQVAVATGEIAGVEALARWQHPVIGEIGAEPLFAAAARAGLELALSEHVQRLALAEAARWPKALADLRLSINVTSADVARSGFADLFLDWVDASGFPRSRLTVEITEGGLIGDLSEAARLLAELRTAGCRVAIDDFGTGYSSLAYLKALPLDYLKIDRKLTQDIAGSPRDRVVVRGVIDMARSLGLTVIAEGVETEEQLELLAKEGCQYYQGFLCAEPLTVAAMAELMETRG